MDRRSKIIVSVVGIFIVLLALIGITYAYFLTRVEGNTNETSISITTANLRIVYDDNNSQINATNIQPGDTVYTKTFTVTNEGNESVEYAVYLENIINDFVHYNDLRMYITCVNQDNETCNGYGIDTDSDGDIDLEDSNIYPRVNSKLIENTIEPAPDADSDGEVHTYTLYLQFRDNGDQSDDMGKVLQGKVQIYDPNSVLAITGNIQVPEGDNTKYYVELHSDVKTSQISSDGTYLFEGVEPQNEAHTLYVKYKDGDGTVQTVGSQQIKVSKGDTASISVTNDNKSSLVINEKVLRANVNITIGNSEITLDEGYIQSLNNFEEGTLASKILSDNTLKDGENLNFDTVIDGLYYTGKNTEDNGVTYFYRGNVDNNYLVLADETKGTCMTDSGVQIYYDHNSYESPSKEECLTSTICVYHDFGGSAYTNQCEGIFGWEDEDGEHWFYPTIYEPGELEVEFTPDTKILSIWRIVRINEDGSVRLIYHGDKDSINNTSPTSIGEYPTNAEVFDFQYYTDGLKLMNDWYDNNLSLFSSNIVDSGFCNDLTYTRTTGTDDYMGVINYDVYGASNRYNQKNPQYICSDSSYLYTTSSSSKGNNKLTNPIGLLTADEAMFAGEQISNSRTYLSNYSGGAVTMSPSFYTFASISGPVDFATFTITGSDYYPNIIYPVINIKGDLIVEGNGTTESPYKVIVE